MFLPIGDSPNPRGTPLVTYGLIAANVVVFLFVSLPLQQRGIDGADPALLEYLRLMGRELGAAPRELLTYADAYTLFVFSHGFKPALPGLGDLVASMFLHQGFLHLGGNMLFLWIFGDNVEARLGRVRYLLVYLATGAVATVTHALFRLDSVVPLIGASGAVSGVLGCYFIWFPRNYVKVLMLWVFLIDVLYIPARIVLGFYLLVENVLPFLISSQGGGVAYGAHIGGFGAGVAAALLASWAKEWVSKATAAAASAPAPEPDLDALIAKGEWRDALRAYTAMSPAQQKAVSGKTFLVLCDGLSKDSYADESYGLLKGFLSANPHSVYLADIHLRLGFLNLHHRYRDTTASQHFLSVLDLNPAWELARLAREGLAEIQSRRQAHK